MGVCVCVWSWGIFLEIQVVRISQVYFSKHKGGLCGGGARVTADKEVTTGVVLTGAYYTLKN